MERLQSDAGKALQKYLQAWTSEAMTEASSEWDTGGHTLRITAVCMFNLGLRGAMTEGSPGWGFVVSLIPSAQVRDRDFERCRSFFAAWDPSRPRSPLA